MTKTQRKRTAVVSMFQNGLSRNTKCAKRDGFRREGQTCFIKFSIKLVKMVRRGKITV